MLPILGTGIVVILAGQRSLRAELSSLRADQHELRTSLRAELGELRTELRDRFTVVDTRLTAIERQRESCANAWPTSEACSTAYAKPSPAHAGQPDSHPTHRAALVPLPGVALNH